jgi:hypothetical protein
VSVATVGAGTAQCTEGHAESAQQPHEDSSARVQRSPAASDAAQLARADESLPLNRLAADAGSVGMGTGEVQPCDKGSERKERPPGHTASTAGGRAAGHRAGVDGVGPSAAEEQELYGSDTVHRGTAASTLHVPTAGGGGRNDSVRGSSEALASCGSGAGGHASEAPAYTGSGRMDRAGGTEPSGGSSTPQSTSVVASNSASSISETIAGVSTSALCCRIL